MVYGAYVRAADLGVIFYIYSVWSSHGVEILALLKNIKDIKTPKASSLMTCEKDKVYRDDVDLQSASHKKKNRQSTIWMY